MKAYQLFGSVECGAPNRRDVSRAAPLDLINWATIAWAARADVLRWPDGRPAKSDAAHRSPSGRGPCRDLDRPHGRPLAAAQAREKERCLRDAMENRVVRGTRCPVGGHGARRRSSPPPCATRRVARRVVVGGCAGRPRGREASRRPVLIAVHGEMARSDRRGAARDRHRRCDPGPVVSSRSVRNRRAGVLRTGLEHAAVLPPVSRTRPRQPAKPARCRRTR
jgi:hypothetical protein